MKTRSNATMKDNIDTESNITTVATTPKSGSISPPNLLKVFLPIISRNLIWSITAAKLISININITIVAATSTRKFILFTNKNSDVTKNMKIKEFCGASYLFNLTNFEDI